MHSFPLLLLLALSSVWAASKYENLDLVDKVGSNLLFRGPSPLLTKGTDKWFDYEGLVMAMANHTTMPEKFFLWDISLLGPTGGDGMQNAIEKAYFDANSTIGAFVLWTIHRSSQDPFKLTPDEIKAKVLGDFPSVNNDSLPYRMGNLSKSLAEQVDVPRVIFFHSEGGTDRAGEVSASYYMQFQKMTLQQATDYNKALPGGEPDQYCINGQAWYCFYLKYALNFDLDCTLK